MAKILICIDHKWRDLPAYVYAAILMERKGHTVQLIRNGFEKYFLVGMRPDLIIMPHIWGVGQQQFAKKLANQGVLVVLMPTEGIATLATWQEYVAGKDNDMSGVDLGLTWSNEMADILAQNPTITRNKIKTIGCPRFDFYRKPLIETIRTKSEFCKEYGWNEYSQIVTVATNFTQAQFHDVNPMFLAEDAERLGYTKVANDSAGSLSEMAQRDFESREILCEAFIRLVNDLPNRNFILKLHPSEDHIYYFNSLKNKLGDSSKRVAIVTQAYIWEILTISDVEIQRSCTTGVESWMLGKPTIEAKLNPDEWYFSPDFASGSYIASSYPDLLRQTIAYLDGEDVSQELQVNRKVFIDKWCHLIDGYRTPELVKQIDLLLSTNKKTKKIKFKLFNWMVWLLIRVTDSKIHDLRVYGFMSLITKKKIDKLGRLDKYFNSSDVKAIKKNLLTSLGQ